MGKGGDLGLEGYAWRSEPQQKSRPYAFGYPLDHMEREGQKNFSGHGTVF